MGPLKWLAAVLAVVFFIVALIGGTTVFLLFTFGAPMFIYDAGWEAGFRAAGGVSRPYSTWEWFWGGLGSIVVGVLAMLGVGPFADAVFPSLKAKMRTAHDKVLSFWKAKRDD
jgi:hypothetical protein